MSTATIGSDIGAGSERLYMAMELGDGSWKLGFTRGFGDKVIKKRVVARDTKAILSTIASVKRSMGVADGVEVRSGYECFPSEEVGHSGGLS